MPEHKAEIIELATLIAETIRRMGAAYGSADEWRRDVTRAVRVAERLSAVQS